MSDSQSPKKSETPHADRLKQAHSLLEDTDPSAFTADNPELSEASREESLLLQLMEKNTQLQFFQGKISKLQHDFEIAQQIIDASPQAVLFLDNSQHILTANQAFCALSGFELHQLLKKKIYHLITLKDSGLDLEKLLEQTRNMSSWQGSILLKRKDHQQILLRLSLRFIDPDKNRNENSGFICQLSQIDNSKTDISPTFPIDEFHHDSLTGLPDRASCQSYLLSCLKQAKKEKTCVGLLHIDIDHFKRINRLFGVGFGDELLYRVSSILQQCAKQVGQSFTGRLGGDEFIVILSPLVDETDAERCVDLILEQCRFALNIHSRDIFYTLSIGISIFPQDGKNSQTLLHNADTAMGMAKSKRGNSSCRWNRNLEKSSEKKLALENDLRLALAAGELSNYFQPQIDLTTGVIIGLEALMRWKHPQHGTISPNIFIPIAENMGLINEITIALFRDACVQGKKWINMGFKDFTIATNISGSVLQDPDLFDKIMDILDSTGFPPDALELELTETVLIENTELISLFIDKCHDQGLTVTIDDFGIGYSSLSYLQCFSVDRIKIDRSFIRGVTSNENDAALTLAIIAMSKELNVRVLAEGVETESQLAFLQKNRCDECQGFLFSRPIPADRMTYILKHDSCIAMQHRRIITKFFSIKSHHTLPGHIAKVN